MNVVYDPVGGERFLDGLRCLRSEGRMVVIGFAEGAIPEVKVNRLLLRNIDVCGASFGVLAPTPGASSGRPTTWPAWSPRASCAR